MGNKESKPVDDDGGDDDDGATRQASRDPMTRCTISDTASSSQDSDEEPSSQDSDEEPSSQDSEDHSSQDDEDQSSQDDEDKSSQDEDKLSQDDEDKSFQGSDEELLSRNSHNNLPSFADPQSILSPQLRADHQYQPSQWYSDETGEQIQIPSTLTAECECMIIGSYGDSHLEHIQLKVAKKLSRMRRGEFLEGVSDDIDILQDMVKEDPLKSLAYVLSDVPGAQRTRDHYIKQIEKFLKNCKKPGALIWYSGHGETGTGDWVFTDGYISLENIIDLYRQHFSGRLLTIVSDCCYAGQWVHQLSEILQKLKIGACGHQAIEAGMVLKIYTSCRHNEESLDAIFAKERVSMEPSLNNSIVFSLKAIEVYNLDHSQTPMSIDTTHITCFRTENNICQLDQIPRRALWSWKDLITGDDRKDRFKRRFFKSWEQWPDQQTWSYVLIFDDELERLETMKMLSSHFPSTTALDRCGYTVFSGSCKTPSPEIEYLITNYGPV